MGSKLGKHFRWYLIWMHLTSTGLQPMLTCVAMFAWICFTSELRKIKYKILWKYYLIKIQRSTLCAVIHCTFNPASEKMMITIFTGSGPGSAIYVKYLAFSSLLLSTYIYVVEPFFQETILLLGYYVPTLNNSPKLSFVSFRLLLDFRRWIVIFLDFYMLNSLLDYFNLVSFVPHVSLKKPV